jgi:Trk-type K+ transport system membrane component
MFVDLTDEQRDELGGVEYRALQTLLLILPSTIPLSMELMKVYFFGLFFLSWICLIPWITRDSNYGNIVNTDGINRPWWAIFTTASLYSNVGDYSFSNGLIVGFTLTPDGMISFQQAVFPLLLLSFVMIAGFPF